MNSIRFLPTRALAFGLGALLVPVAATQAALQQADIFPKLMDAPPAKGSIVTGTDGAFTINAPGIDRSALFVNMTFDVLNPTPEEKDRTGDVMTFAFESISGDFDKRVRIHSITTDPATPVDANTMGGLMVRTGNEAYKASLQIAVGNPASGGANRIEFIGRPLDGQNYTPFSREYRNVSRVVPNQWLRLRRVGDYFAAYLGTNGVNWTLIGERYQEWPANVVVGAFASAGRDDVTARVQYSSYGDVPTDDTIPPRLVSAGTIDKKLVGVKFSEMVSSATATDRANYRLSEGTINGVKMGIGGDAVYLEVSGLVSDTFSVTVVGGIKDTAGNLIAANSVAQARALNWVSQDLGNIQNPNQRPTPGDDPYRVGRAVMVNSDENPEIEIVGGGSNAWNPGDYIHYIYRQEPLSGSFDVTIAVSRYDRSANQGGYSNSGLMLRASPYLAGEEFTVVGTQVPMVANTTYLERSTPERGAIPLWRTAEHGGYGNGNADFRWDRVIGGIKGYYSGLRAVDASGAVDTRSSASSARYLRITRTNTVYTFYASWDGVSWAQVHRETLATLPDKLLLGFSTMTDSGAFAPPLSAYGNNGHQIEATDPLNPANAPEPAGGRGFMNESNYAAQRIKVFPNGVKTPLPVDLDFADIAAADGSSTALAGRYTSTGTYSFEVAGGGSAAFRNAGDELSFAYQEVTGDFDKQMRVASIATELFNADGSAYVPEEGAVLPVDAWARGGLMVRSSTNDSSASLKILAANPAGANVVEVRGRGIDAQNYTIFSRSYPGVTNALPNQWLRMKRVGDSFSFYVSKEGVAWVLVAQRYQPMPAKLFIGGYAAAALNPEDANANPLGLKARTVVRVEDYKNVDLGDLVPPALLSAGTLDKKTVGVKFSEAVSSATGTDSSNFKLSQGTVSNARIGIGGDTVYLTVTGLTADTVTLTVTGVKDTAGNTIAASTTDVRYSAWTSQDIGFIQNPNNRPTPGDDPYRVGQAVAISSDENPEVEIVGGGSNAWNSGDFLHYLYRSTPLVGDFDVAVAVSRYDRSANQGGYSNSGLMLRASPYLAGEEHTAAGTKVPMVANVTYLENSGPGRGAIPLWRSEPGGGYGNGKADFSWTTVIGGIKGYFGPLRATDSVGTRDPQSSPDSARYLRIKREGSTFRFYASWDGREWDNYHTETLASLPNTLLLGVSTMTDSGAFDPFTDGTVTGSAYGGNGHTLDPNDPLNPANFPGVSGNRSLMNESNYAAQRIRIYPSGVPPAGLGPLSVTLTGGMVRVSWPGGGTLQSAPTVNGPWTATSSQANPYETAPIAAQVYYRLIQ